LAQATEDFRKRQVETTMASGSVRGWPSFARAAEDDERGRTCERCLWLEATQHADDPSEGRGGSSRACLFCAEAGGKAYVPIHFGPGLAPGEAAPGGGAAAASAAEASLLTAEAPAAGGAAALGGAGGARGAVGPVAYSDALQGHRGCARCWLRWEAQQVRRASSRPSHSGSPVPALDVKCPVCNLTVDVRRGYEAVLCRPCQHAVVARGGRWVFVLARARACFRRMQGLFALCFLCLGFGLQALVAVVVWQLAGQLLHGALMSGVRVNGHDPPPHGGGPSHVVIDFNASVVSAAHSAEDRLAALASAAFG